MAQAGRTSRPQRQGRNYSVNWRWRGLCPPKLGNAQPEIAITIGYIAIKMITIGRIAITIWILGGKGVIDITGNQGRETTYGINDFMTETADGGNLSMTRCIVKARIHDDMYETIGDRTKRININRVAEGERKLVQPIGERMNTVTGTIMRLQVRMNEYGVMDTMRKGENDTRECGTAKNLMHIRSMCGPRCAAAVRIDPSIGIRTRGVTRAVRENMEEHTNGSMDATCRGATNEVIMQEGGLVQKGRFRETTNMYCTASSGRRAGG